MTTGDCTRAETAGTAAGRDPTSADAGVAASGGAPAAGAGPRLVYCGGCNPHIDRGALAAALAADESTGGDAAGAAPPVAGERAAVGDAGPGRATVYLSGCARACASGHRLTSDEPGEVVVAGEVVDGRPTPARDLAATIRQKLKE